LSSLLLLMMIVLADGVALLAGWWTGDGLGKGL